MQGAVYNYTLRTIEVSWGVTVFAAGPSSSSQRVCFGFVELFLRNANFMQASAQSYKPNDPWLCRVGSTLFRANVNQYGVLYSTFGGYRYFYSRLLLTISLYGYSVPRYRLCQYSKLRISCLLCPCRRSVVFVSYSVSSASITEY